MLAGLDTFHHYSSSDSMRAMRAPPVGVLLHVQGSAPEILASSFRSCRDRHSANLGRLPDTRLSAPGLPGTPFPPLGAAPGPSGGEPTRIVPGHGRGSGGGSSETAIASSHPPLPHTPVACHRGNSVRSNPALLQGGSVSIFLFPPIIVSIIARFRIESRFREERKR